MLMIGIESLALSAAERGYLQHPAVVGVVLFARNYADRAQLADLCADIRASAAQVQLIAVDQEGGRVQRFRAGFARLPCLQDIGAVYAADRPAARELARSHAFVMASEIIAAGLDFSFAPVADLALGNLAIGNRAFAAAPDMAADCITAYIEGMHQAGMAATLKHFPGHGSVREDTHFDTAIDRRGYQQIAAADLLPFRAGIATGAEAVMMAHVVYPQVDAEPAGYSAHWIGEVLRRQLGFQGTVFSDDIGMAAAGSAGGIGARIRRHLSAGCDVILACPPESVPEAVAAMPVQAYDVARLVHLRARAALHWGTLESDQRHVSALQALGKLEQA